MEKKEEKLEKKNTKKNSVKRQSSILITCISCILLLLVLCYFGMSNTKGTYSAGSCEFGSYAYSYGNYIYVNISPTGGDYTASSCCSYYGYTACDSGKCCYKKNTSIANGYYYSNPYYTTYACASGYRDAGTSVPYCYACNSGYHYESGKCVADNSSGGGSSDSGSSSGSSSSGSSTTTPTCTWGNTVFASYDWSYVGISIDSTDSATCCKNYGYYLSDSGKYCMQNTTEITGGRKYANNYGKDCASNWNSYGKSCIKCYSGYTYDSENGTCVNQGVTEENACTVNSIYNSGTETGVFYAKDNKACCTNGWTYSSENSESVGEMSCKTPVNSITSGSTVIGKSYVKMSGIDCTEGYKQTGVYCVMCNSGYVVSNGSCVVDLPSCSSISGNCGSDSIYRNETVDLYNCSNSGTTNFYYKTGDTKKCKVVLDEDEGTIATRIYTKYKKQDSSDLPLCSSISGDCGSESIYRNETASSYDCQRNGTTYYYNKTGDNMKCLVVLDEDDGTTAERTYNKFSISNNDPSGSSGGGGYTPNPGDDDEPTPNPGDDDGTSDTPSDSDTPSNPDDGGNVTENPTTGSIMIFIVWVITLSVVIYGCWYIKRLRTSE